MPETLEELRKARADHGTYRDMAEAAQGVRNIYLRRGRQEGLSLRSLSEASGLSIAQVQRICDLSKDVTCIHCGSKQHDGRYCGTNRSLSKDRSE